MRAFPIIMLCIVASICYGIIHDNITARICVEYFSVFHPRVISSNDPTALAFTWGVLATWWVGEIIGIPLAIAARAGSRPKLEARDLVRPILVLFVVVGISAFIGGLVGYGVVTSHLVDPEAVAPFIRGRIAPERYVRLSIDSASHGAAYWVGGLGGVFLWIHTWRCRGRMARGAPVESPVAVS